MSQQAAPSVVTDEITMNAFHKFLTLALAQAKAERLLDEETLASAEADIMVSGPALCLYFAALRSSTTPPSIPLPPSVLPPGTPPTLLSSETVPRAFKAFFSIWSALTPAIQALTPEQSHDLARLICGHEPLSQSASRHEQLRRMALDMRAVAIEISQRRTFQERYQSDLQAALDHGRPMSDDGRRTPSPLRATFVPPPGYECEKPLPPSPTSPRPVTPTSPMRVTNPDLNGFGREPSMSTSPTSPLSTPIRVPSPNRPNVALPSTPPRTQPGHRRNQSSQYLELPGRTTPGRPTITVPSSSSSSPGRRSPSPAVPAQLNSAIETIRETLYAELAEVLSKTKELRGLLATDQPRAYFASVGLAILEFSLNALTPDGGVRAVLGAELKMEDVPREYRPLMAEVQAIARRSRELEEEDNRKAIELLTAGEDTLPEPRMDRLKRMLIKGVARGWEELQRDQDVSGADTEVMAGAAFESQVRRSARGSDQGAVRARSRDRSPEGTVLQLANRINALALAMTRLPAFRERQDKVFKVLAGVGA
ncbi:hypothetical protein FRC01_002251 [Tulasnella sp. 417]|nr:hypothetical protein FRC01_002251 [Tulasnella sp. 417]